MSLLMGREIERKFLVRGDFRAAATDSTVIVQGYLNSDPGRTVRVRLRGDRGFLTVKGAGLLSRGEWEYEIPAADARELLALCEPGVVEKRRYRVPAGGHLFEVDCFGGANEGLVVAEVELRSEEEPFDRPAWLGEEVTGQERYCNSMLAKHPYTEW